MLKTNRTLKKTTVPDKVIINNSSKHEHFIKKYISEIKEEIKNKKNMAVTDINLLLENKYIELFGKQNIIYFDYVCDDDDEELYDIYNLLDEINTGIIVKNKIKKEEEKEKEIINNEEIIMDPKEEFRKICEQNINYIRQIMLPEIKLDQKYEAVLIEYRCFPHLEFLIRNTILKLGPEWSQTIICGNLNYDFICDMCSKISPNIKIIRTNYDNLNQTTYSLFMASLDFWNLFVGEKILIYQEDSCIFRNNINNFLEWDYVGAPWAKTQNDTLNCVGNGGFSLRTKKIMKKVIKFKSINEIEVNSSTENYMKNTGMTIVPEDVYFSKTMQDFNIGKVADWDTARMFSTESINCIDSFGGHNFWISDKKWKFRVCSETIKSFKLYGKFVQSEHRGGWNTIMKTLIDNKFINNNSPNMFLDTIERYFLWEINNPPIITNWCGFIHCTPITPPYLDIVNIQNLFKCNAFINSLVTCECIFTLSTYITNYLKKEFEKKGRKINIITIKHPTDLNDIIYFDIEKYYSNPNKKILQIGQQLRKVTSIYLLNIVSHEKVWLTGTRNLTKCQKLFDDECNYLNLQIENTNVKMYYTETTDEYDKLLSENIVFVDFFDAAANNTIIECIARNTPIICKKTEATIEYLGDNYPLFFNELDDVYELLSVEKIKECFEYLENMNKKDIQIEYFIKELFNSVNLRV